MKEERITEGLLDNRDKLIGLINRLLQDILNTTIDMPIGNSRFHAKNPPNLPVQDYLARLKKINNRPQ